MYNINISDEDLNKFYQNFHFQYSTNKEYLNDIINYYYTIVKNIPHAFIEQLFLDVLKLYKHNKVRKITTTLLLDIVPNKYSTLNFEVKFSKFFFIKRNISVTAPIIPFYFYNLYTIEQFIQFLKLFYIRTSYTPYHTNNLTFV